MAKWRETCPNCKKEVTAKIVKCEKCGKPHKEMPSFCPHCGAFLRGETVYEFM
jgi:primosomal protein N'